MNLPEGLLWQVLRTRPGGLKFRRQHPIGPFVADFYCAAAKLVVEVDGISHELGSRRADDARRSAWLKERGLRVLRYKASDVLSDCNGVVGDLVKRIGGRTLPLHHAAHGPPPHEGVGRN